MEEAQIIKTIGENGEEVNMKLQEIVNVNNQDYALLSVADNKSDSIDDDENELVIMRMHKTDNECTFEIIEDDEEFDLVASAISDDEDDIEE